MSPEMLSEAEVGKENSRNLSGLEIEIQTIGQDLASREALQILHGNFPNVLNDLQEAVTEPEKGKRLQLLSALSRKLGMAFKVSGSEENSVLQKVGAFASLAVQSSRDSKMNDYFTHKATRLFESGREFESKIHQNEQVIYKELNHFLTESKPVDHGTQSVVYRLGLKKQPKKFREALVSEGVDNSVLDSAVKVLKIYRRGLAKAEYGRQVQAYELIQKGRKSKKTATMSVPKPYLFQDVPIDHETRQRLENNKCKLPDGHAEVLMMGFVNGKDFQHIILSKALSIKGQKLNFAKLDSQELYYLAGEEFDFVKIAPGASPTQQWKARSENMSKIYNFFKRNGVKINPAIVGQLRNGLEVWEEANFTHGDLHERNLMYEGTTESFFSDDETKVGQVFAIDFGPLPAEEAEFVEPEQDRVVLNRFAELNK